jgi:crotonobetainyl-CoA:carnitine CoA-transferase CaiB-like acyl-CoA transferase
VFLKLVAESDVLVQNFRPEVMNRLGFAYKKLRHVNPRLVMASLSGYGEIGPKSHLGGQDLLAQAHSGLIALQGYEDEQPRAAGAAIADGVGAISAAWGVMVALYERERSGLGQEVTTNLIDSLLGLIPMDWAEYLYSGQIHKSGRGTWSLMPYGPWQAQDRGFVVMFLNEAGWRELCLVVGLPEMELDPRFATNADRVAHRRELEDILFPVFATRKAEEWVAMLGAMGVRCELVNSFPDVENDPQTRVNEMIIEQVHPIYGAIRTVGQAIKLKRTPGIATHSRHLPPPLFAEHTREILEELG